MQYTQEFKDRFEAKIEKGPECWAWKGCRTRSGYGLLQARKISKAPLLAHRVAWELTNGPIPDGMHVLHRCDNPGCVNPGHLFLGTQRDNNADRDAKGRVASGDSNGARTKPSNNPFVRDGGSGLRGQGHPQAKLTDEQVRCLRLSKAMGHDNGFLATVYGISVTHVWRIVTGRSRRD